MKKLTTKDILFIAMFAALTAAFSQIVIPVGVIPLNLATLSVFLCGGLLKAARGGASQLVYVLLGAAGLPVFAGFTGGFGRIVGPTGGFIIGYIVAAAVIGLFVQRLPRKFWLFALAMLAGAVCYFTTGTLWYMCLYKASFISALWLCVIPFIPGDIIKIILAAYLVKRLERFV